MEPFLLQGYRAAVFRLATSTSSSNCNPNSNLRLTHFSNCLSRLGEQVNFLARVCKLDNNEEKESDLPTGVQLLRYLLDRTLHINARHVLHTLVLND